MALVLSLLFACASASQVCDAQVRAAETCDWMVTDAACEANLSSCTTEDLGRWNAWYGCLADDCAAGADQSGVGEGCIDLLEGVSWGCSPSGAIE